MGTVLQPKAYNLQPTAYLDDEDIDGNLLMSMLLVNTEGVPDIDHQDIFW